MDSKFFIIKLKDEVRELNDFKGYLERSIEPEENIAYYNLVRGSSVADNNIFDKQMEIGKEYRCALLGYTNKEITCLYWAKCFKHDDGRYRSIQCRLLYKVMDKKIIETFKDCLQLGLDYDFGEGSHISCEYSELLLKQMKRYESLPYEKEASLREYPVLREEADLSEWAQKNEYCNRKYDLGVDENRGEFQRDYDRILYSKAYRRMVDKAQIFSSSKGDHYRTRMTHTLIVSQISRSIAKALRLNCALAEAIAMGHDLGHTPFGHQGERTLHAILTGKKGFEVSNLAIEINGEKTYPYGGFKHNYQSVRVASKLEEYYLDIDGLNLSRQTLDGMLMHTRLQGDVDINEFTEGYLCAEGYSCEGDKYAETLEGQVVTVADEIAQRSHDIDDAFASNLITIDDLQKYLELRKVSELKNKIDEMLKEFENLKGQNRLYADEDRVKSTRISALIVDYFINDVIKETLKRMAEFSIEEFNSAGHKIDFRMVWFSEIGDQICKYLEKIITKRAINSREVTVFDQNGSNIVLALFRAYYQNPMLLHSGTLNRIWIDYRKHGMRVVDFKEGRSKDVREFWEGVTTSTVLDDREVSADEKNDVIVQRRILVRSICDFISGMTDSYAMNEYRKIVL